MPALSWVVAAAVAGLVGIMVWADDAAQGSGRAIVGAAISGLLLLYALVRSLVAIFGPLPPQLHKSMAFRWRIAWSVGALSAALLALTNITFAVNDHVRSAEERFCATAPGGPSGDLASEDGAVTTTAQPPATTGSSRTTLETPTTTPVAQAPSPIVGDQSVADVAFGFERGVRSRTFTVTAADPDHVERIVPDDFIVLTDDGRETRAFARVASVTPLLDGRAAVRLQFDLSCYHQLEGGAFNVQAAYRGDVELDRRSWTMNVTLQSRLLFYFIAALPVITVLAIYQVFSVWPITVKRWFTSLVAIVVPVLTAYRVAGLDNASWSPKLMTVAALIGATYAAAVTAAAVVKTGGHDLADDSDPASITESRAN